MSRWTRYALIGAGVLSIASGFVLKQRVAHADPWREAPTHMRANAAARLPDAVHAIRRDPFAGVAAAPGAGAAPMTGPGVPQFDTGGDVVPDPGALPGGGGVDISVIGTMVGGTQHPLALVRKGNETSVVGVGDILGGRKIARILAEGIVFADGSRLAVNDAPIAPSDVAPPASAPAFVPAFVPARVPSPQTTTPFATPTPAAALTATPDPRRRIFDFSATPPPSNGATPRPLPRLFTPPPSAHRSKR